MRSSNGRFLPLKDYSNSGFCIMENCNREVGNHGARGLCPKHYMNWKIKQTPEISVWSGMKSRCSNPNDRSYSRYGGRGIKVCEQWKVFANFFKDMGARPSSNHSIERIDNNGDYEPTNCRWATAPEQAMNKRVRSDSKTGLQGVKLRPHGKYQARIVKNGRRISLGHFATPEEASLKYQEAKESILTSMTYYDKL